jgi:ribosomal protein L29
MEIAKVRKLNSDELRKEVVKIQHKITEMRSEVLMHRVKNHQELRALRQYLARLLTVENEKALLATVSDPGDKNI